MNDAVIIDARGLSKSFKGAGEDLSILSSLDLLVREGSTVSITGESGSGKSTLLNILGGLERASSGSLEVAGYDLAALGEEELDEYRGKALGFVFQFHFLLKDFTALENVMMPALVRGARKKDARESALGLLASVGLERRAGHYPSELSGGERQRAALARALINGPRILLADEPTGNLDRATAGVVEEILFALASERGATLVLVTHDLALAARCDESYALEGGRLSPR
jgi:lipoprotein-releasing system ATP-binding protein